MKHLAVFCAAVLLVPAIVLAQAETTGRITGRVLDEEGLPIAGARVSLISSALQGERTSRTETNGEFLVALLPVGPYAVSVAAPGRQTVQVSLRLGVGQTVPLEIVMAPGADIVEEVTVHGTASPLETTVGGENFDYDETVEELPIANRNILNVARYAPNVVEGPWNPEVLTGLPTGAVVSGAPSFDTNVQLEGTDISDPIFGQGLQLYLEDAVEEVQVQTSGISARYGRFQGGVINTITKTGGNEFDGTLRAEFSKESWNSTTPFGEEQSDDLNQIYQATLGGYMLRDKLWFFVGARAVPTETIGGTTFVTSESFEVTSDDRRWQLKLRGAPSPNHVIEASYLERDFEQTGGDGGDLLAATATRILEPMSLFTLTYQGILGRASFLDVRASSKRHGTNCCSGDTSRSAFFDWGQYAFFNNQEGDPNVEYRRDGDSASAAFTRVFSGGNLGSHTFEGGAQFVRSTVSGVLSISPTHVGVDAFPLGSTPFAALDSQSGEVRYNLGGEVFAFRNEDIPVPDPESIVDNYAIYAQDAWQLGDWRFDLGLRWERYEVSTYRDDLETSVDALAPRIGVTYNVTPKWQVQGTWGRYNSRFHDRLLGVTARIFDYAIVGRAYTGPVLTDLTAAEVEDVLRDDSQWDLVTMVLDPEQPTGFLAQDIELPYTDEFTLGIRGGLPKSSGSFTATYIDRAYKNLLDDFQGDLGARSLVDPFTGDPLIDPSTNEPALFDIFVWDNAPTADRRYRAFAVTGDYRPGARWDIGGNWTWSKLEGNQDIPWRQALNGTAIGTYERSRPEASAVPDGYLLDDQRHRLQVWGNYRFDLKRAGALALGAVGRYESGRNWSRVAYLPLADDPGYNLKGDEFYIHYFDGRGNNRFDDWWTLDVSARWQFPIFKRLQGWVKATVLNVLDNDVVISYDTTGQAVDDGSGDLVWEPVGNCGPGDAPSTACTGFGSIHGPQNYQLPRRFWFTLGLAF